MKNNCSENSCDIIFRLTKLEEFCLSLSAHLEGERVLRKEEDQKCKQLYDIISNQLNEIKETQPNETFNKRFLSLKEQLVNMIDSKIGEKMIENKNRLESQYIHIKAGEDSMIKKQENIFNHYKFELNNLNKRIDLLENNYNKKINDMSNKIEEINKVVNTLKIFNTDLTNKINEINNNLSKIEKGDIKKIKILENDIKNINLNYKEKEEKSEIDLNNNNENLSFLKNEFSSLSEKYLTEIEEIKNNFENQKEIENKEITNFEKHLLSEYENFTKFMTNILNQNIDKIKSMNEYLNSDVEIVKNKNKYIEETLLKLREDVFDSMNKNSKFILDKMKSHFNSQINYKSHNFEDEKEIYNDDIDNNKSQ
mgnify:FL=1